MLWSITGEKTVSFVDQSHIWRNKTELSCLSSSSYLDSYFLLFILDCCCEDVTVQEWVAAFVTCFNVITLKRTANQRCFPCHVTIKECSIAWLDNSLYWELSSDIKQATWHTVRFVSNHGCKGISWWICKSNLGHWCSFCHKILSQSKLCWILSGLQEMVDGCWKQYPASLCIFNIRSASSPQLQAPVLMWSRTAVKVWGSLDCHGLHLSEPVWNHETGNGLRTVSRNPAE